MVNQLAVQRLYSAPHVSKSRFDFTKSRETRRIVYCRVKQSARADGVLRPSGFIKISPVSTLLTRIFSRCLPKVSNLILKVHNFQLPTKRQSPRLQTHYGSKRRPRTLTSIIRGETSRTPNLDFLESKLLRISSSS